MTNTLHQHVAMYQGAHPYDVDNKIPWTRYLQRLLHHASAAWLLLKLGLGHRYTTNMGTHCFAHPVVAEESPTVIRNGRDPHLDCRAKIVDTRYEYFATDEWFDIIVMGFIIEHLAEPLWILPLLYNFLAPDGKMLRAVANTEVLHHRLDPLAGLLDNVATVSENHWLLGHKRCYTVDNRSAGAAQTGCGGDWLEGIYFEPCTTRQIISLQLDSKLSCALLANISTR